MKYGWTKVLWIGLCVLAISPPLPAQANPDEVIIVSSSENTYFEQTAATLRRHLDERLAARDIDIGDLAAVTGRRDTSLYVTLGLQAAIEVKRTNPQARVISAYITREQHLSLTSDPGDAAVLLDQPLVRYLVFSKLVLDNDSVGVIEQQPLILDARETDILEQFQLKLEQHRIDNERKLLPVLRELMIRNDALLMLPRQSIYNPDTLKAVLLTGYRKRKPIVSYSPAHVRSGALASIYSSPVDIGRHLALLVNQRTREPPGPAMYEYARFYSIATNPRVAQALSIALPDETRLRQQLDALGP